MTPYAPEVFTYQRSPGVFDPIIVHEHSTQLVSPDSPASRGEYVIIYGTGIGDLTSLPTTGTPSPTDPLAAATLLPTVTIGGVNATVGFAGLTPGAIGLTQFNVQLPNNLPVGTSFPLVINFNGSAREPVSLAVKTTP